MQKPRGWLLQALSLPIGAAAAVTFCLVAYGVIKGLLSPAINYLPASATVLSASPICAAEEVKSTGKPPGHIYKFIGGTCDEVATKLAAFPDRVFTTTRTETLLDLGFATTTGVPVRTQAYAVNLQLGNDVQSGTTVNVVYRENQPTNIQREAPGAGEHLRNVLAFAALLIGSGGLTVYLLGWRVLAVFGVRRNQ